MWNRRLLLASICALLVSSIGASAAPIAPADPQLDTDRRRYERGEDVVITLTNQADYPLRMGRTWRIVNRKDEVVASFIWSDASRTLQPGETRTWTWRQDPNTCSEDGGCTKVGGFVARGRYKVIVRTQDGTVRARFLIGKYYTVAFRCEGDGCEHHNPHVVFVAREDAIAQMDAELEKPADERTMIVSGIVRASARYNPSYSYTMRPRSIVLGEVFIEVCDANPAYVEENRKEWMGQRWCPWSSYVAAAGRHP